MGLFFSLIKISLSSCLFDLYMLILNSLLRAYAYPGKASHISINFSSIDNGLILKLTGFNQHLSKYLETVIKVIYDFQVNEEGTLSWKQELKDQYFRELNNSKKLIKYNSQEREREEERIFVFRHVRFYLMKNIWWPVFEKIKFLDDITHKQISDFSILFRSHLTVNMLVAGNMTGEVIQIYFHDLK